MGVLKGYFDDSLTEGKLWAVGGYVGSLGHWDDFELFWPNALANHGVPYFHMREMQKPNGGIFSKWYPAEEHKAELVKFFSDLTTAIRRSAVNGICCIVRLEDLERFNREYNLNLQAYSLAAYGCMLLVGKQYPGQVKELIFDHVEKVKSKLELAVTYVKSDNYYGPDGVFKKLIPIGLPEDVTSRDVPALQAADFWTWEFRKNHLNLDGWWSLQDRPQQWGDEQWEHMRTWVEDSYGGFEEFTRRSAQALFARGDFQCMIWHYQELCEAHKARGGVWA